MIKIVTFFLVALMMVGQPNNGNQNIIGSADVESDIKIITGQAPTETVVEELPLTISNEDLAQYQPNEMGGVVVAMYHNLVETEAKEGAYHRTPDNFRKDLTRLWQEGYLPVSIDDYVNGTIDIPIGKSPVVFTFDDGYQNCIKYTADGTLDPDCVIGIFEAFYAEHPDFVPKATFYLNQSVFGDDDFTRQKIDFIVRNPNYTLGNHTIDHSNLRKISKAEVARIIVEEGELLEGLTGQTTFHFAVPFGEKPKAYFDWLKEDDFLGKYKMLSSLNVGWNPAPSPYDSNFNRYSINRITCGEDNCELHYWLDVLRDNPKRRYISDGNPRIVTVPVKKADDLMLAADDQRVPIIYDENGVIE